MHTGHTAPAGFPQARRDTRAVIPDAPSSHPPGHHPDSGRCGPCHGHPPSAGHRPHARIKDRLLPGTCDTFEPPVEHHEYPVPGRAVKPADPTRPERHKKAACSVNRGRYPDFRNRGHRSCCRYCRWSPVAPCSWCANASQRNSTRPGRFRTCGRGPVTVNLRQRQRGTQWQQSKLRSAGNSASQ